MPIGAFFEGLEVTEDDRVKTEDMAFILSTDPKACALLRAFAKAPERTRKRILDLVEVIVAEL